MMFQKLPGRSPGQVIQGIALLHQLGTVNRAEDREKILNQANMVTPSILAGSTSRKDVSKSMITFAAAMGVMLGALGPIASAIGSSAWIAKTILGKKR